MPRRASGLGCETPGPAPFSRNQEETRASQAILIDMLCILGRDKMTIQKAQEIVDRHTTPNTRRRSSSCALLIPGQPSCVSSLQDRATLHCEVTSRVMATWSPAVSQIKHTNKRVNHGTTRHCSTSGVGHFQASFWQKPAHSAKNYGESSSPPRRITRHGSTANQPASSPSLENPSSVRELDAPKAEEKGRTFGNSAGWRTGSRSQC